MSTSTACVAANRVRSSVLPASRTPRGARSSRMGPGPESARRRVAVTFLDWRSFKLNQAAMNVDIHLASLQCQMALAYIKDLCLKGELRILADLSCVLMAIPLPA